MEPFDQFIPRQIEDKELEKILNAFSWGLEAIVDFGSNLVKWDVDTARGHEDNLPITLSLRHFLDLIDGASILIKKSSVDPAKLLLRGALETYFAIEYLFEKDTEQRCMAFLVWHAHKKLKSYKRLDNSTQQGKQLEQSIKKDELLTDFSLPTIPGLSDAISNLESLLRLPLYQQAEAEYQRLVNQGEKNPTWYRLFGGPSKIEELAQRLNLSAFYEVLYREWSGPTHGTDIVQGKIFANSSNTVDFVQIRYAKDAQSAVSWGMTLSLRTFQTFIKNRLPDKLDEYKNWYKTIKPLYQRVTSKEQIIRVV
ncbi:MAG: DUF5677 domain-containing protein [Cyclobacteriaceae bacterium]|jgi:hypothetical protein